MDFSELVNFSKLLIDQILPTIQMPVTLHQFKADPFQKGQTIQIFSTGSSTHPSH